MSLSLISERAALDLESDLEETEANRLFPSQPLGSAALRCLNILAPSSCRALLMPAVTTILPSFLHGRTGFDHARPDNQIRSSYLDGMRGVAALFVFFCHYSYSSFVITLGYGYGRDGKNDHFLRLPIIRLSYSGPPMVCLFFIISGYSLTLKPLRQMRSKSWESLFTTITSSVFRRGLRLFIPPMISTFMVAVMLQLGWYDATRDFASNKEFIRNVMENHPPRLPTLVAQLRDWGWQMVRFIHIWGWEPFGGSTGYDVHLWTIPVEFRCSMVLFLTLIGLARLRACLRLTLLALISAFTLRNDRWEMVLFFSGMFLAELDLIRLASAVQRPPLSLAQTTLQARPRSSRLLWIAVAMLALYFMSQPDAQFAETPGWETLGAHIPSWFSEKYRFWQCVGSFLFVAAVARLPVLQTPFNQPLVQYLGKISYALYLMHGPVTHTVGYMVERWAWGITGTATPRQYRCGFLLHVIINVPIVIWVSDLFWRAIDAPSVRFARWVEEFCCITIGRPQISDFQQALG